MPKKWRYVLPVLGVLVAALFVTALASLTRYQYARSQQYQRFNDIAHAISRAVDQQVSAYVGALRDISALFRASESVDRDEFFTFMQGLEVPRRYPGLNCAGYAPRVVRTQLAAFAHRVRTEREPTGEALTGYKIFPMQDRDIVYPVLYVFPFADNRGTLGFDLMAEPRLREVLVDARDNGIPVATGNIVLPRVGRPELFLAMPVYRAATLPPTIAARRASIEGFVYGRLDPAGLLQNIRGSLPSHLDFELFDVEENSKRTLLYDYDGVLHRAASAPTKMHKVFPIEAVGRTWELHVYGLDDFGGGDEEAPWLILTGGLMASLLLAGITFIQTKTLEERREQAAQLAYQATHDSLTALPNRHLLYELLDRRLTAETTTPFVLLLIDLDGFKEINDTLGHQSGDQLLCQIGPRIEQLVYRDYTLARLGGDEFALLSDRTLDDDGSALAESVLGAFHDPFDIAGLKIRVGASIGIALSPDHGRDTSTLMRCADIAMYNAKKGAGGYARYRSELDEHTPRKLALITDLADAVAQCKLILHYQPIVRLRDGAVHGVEALVRWPHPDYGLIMPNHFIPQAEKSELIHAFTLCVLDIALAQCARWRAGAHRLTVAVNISARNLQDSDLAANVAGLLRKHALPAAALQLEITESAIISDRERSLATMQALSEVGVGIDIDDFGTGYSSLVYLKRLPAQTLKIDSSFVTDMQTDENDKVIVQSTIQLAHNLGMRVVAEGVETQAVLDALKTLGCDYAQGHFISRPNDAEAIGAWLAANDRAKI